MFGTTDRDKLSQLPDAHTGSLVRGQTGRFKVQVALDTPEVLAGLESYAAGDTYSFAYWYDEVHVVISGTAKILYSLPPLHHAIEERLVGPGDTYLIPKGARFWWEIGPDDAFVHQFCVMPNVFHEPDAPMAE